MKSYNQQAKQFGEQFAESWFKDWKEEYGGTNFTWEKFPDMVKKFAVVHCGLSLFWENKTKRAEELRNIAGEAAYEKTIEILKRENILTREGNSL
jgi:hypothetical protein